MREKTCHYTACVPFIIFCDCSRGRGSFHEGENMPLYSRAAAMQQR